LIAEVVLLLLLLLVQAEVQGKNQDGGIQLHTRSIKFGKVADCTAYMANHSHLLQYSATASAALDRCT
jgi:hypothetical protein